MSNSVAREVLDILTLILSYKSQANKEMTSKKYQPLAVYNQKHFYKVEDLGDDVRSAIFYINNPKKSLDCANLKKTLSSLLCSGDNNLSDTNILTVEILEKEKNCAKVKIDFPLDQHLTQFYQHLCNCDDSLLKFSQNGFADWIPADINSEKNAEWFMNLFNILLKAEGFPLLESTSGVAPCLQLIFLIIEVLQWTVLDRVAQCDEKFDTVLDVNKQDCLTCVEKIENELDAVFTLMQTKPFFFKKKQYMKIHAGLDQLLNSLKDFMKFLKKVSTQLHEHLKSIKNQKICWTAAYVAAICTAVGFLAYGALNVGLLFRKKLLLGGIFVAGKVASEISLLREGLEISIARQSEILDQINNFHSNIQEMEVTLTGKSLNQMSDMKEEMEILAKEFKIACVDIRKVFEGKSRNK
ncbi:5081_t:CDS:10 [Ambispora leptoticha]|uniref:5081_t:CDS:1 n=1 Tax=Ambispora leptoticha TaxID=144679 RepID=A0A9N8V7J9_9GLOM|nr:5081_t:CDS:10 [Ambispora leptoticha]